VALARDDAPPRIDPTTLPVALAGLGLLVLRPAVALSNSDLTIPLLMLVYAALAAGSLAASDVPATGSTGSPRLSPVIVFGLGALAFSAPTAFLGPIVPAPLGTWSLPFGALAAVAEEAFFRRFLYGRLARLGAVAAVLGSAGLFAAIHLPAYGIAVLPVDLAAGLLLSWQRWASGSWTAPAVTHAVANVLAAIR
jgi:membrane protease YdiL (CAAX protease family)